MRDLMKELARAKPPAPEVDHDRMERDLAQIVALPRSSPRGVWVGQAAWRRLAPVAVAFGVVALLVIALLPSDRATQVAEPAAWWHVLTRHTSLLPVGDPANPYVMQLASDTDEWFAPGQHVKVSQLNGIVTPKSADDDTKWQAAGAPRQVPIVGMNHSLRIGPMRPGRWKDENSTFANLPYEAIDRLPADGNGLQVSPDLAMRLAIAPLRADQRQALLALLRTKARNMGEVTLPGGTVGVGVALTPAESPQFGPVENQLIVDERTAVPIVFRQVMTTPRYGLPAGTAVWTEEYAHLGFTEGAEGPPAVPVNDELESPIIER